MAGFYLWKHPRLCEGEWSLQRFQRTEHHKECVESPGHSPHGRVSRLSWSRSALFIPTPPLRTPEGGRARATSTRLTPPPRRATLRRYIDKVNLFVEEELPNLLVQRRAAKDGERKSVDTANTRPHQDDDVQSEADCVSA